MATSTTLAETCPASKSLIGDGICEDDINTEICAYDGGDCCLEEKITDLCHDCICTFTVDENRLMLRFADDTVKTFKSKAWFDLVFRKAVKTFAKVSSVNVCSQLCFVTASGESTNSWIYTIEVADCTCTLLDTIPCYDLSLLASPQRPPKDFAMFIQIGKTIPCG